MATRRRPADLADHSWERVAAREVSRLVVIAPPFIGWALLLATGAVLYRAWPGTLGAACVTVAAAGLAVLDVHLTRQRKGLGRYLAAVTTLAAGCWLAGVMAAGLHSAQVKTWLVGGGALALAWARWLHVHEAGDEAGMSKPFGKAALKAGFAGVRLIGSKVISPGVTKATIDHPGIVHDDIARAIPQIEASWPKAGGLPPGTIIAARNLDGSGRTDVVFSDPRVLNKPIPWPGPSRAGASISEPVRVGRWQDGTDDDSVVTGYHRQVMAMALALDTPVPTPAGWTTMGGLRDGDTVFDEAGQPVRVVRAHPVLRGRPCYEVRFSDGSVITADADHRWLVDTRASRLSEGQQRNRWRWDPPKGNDHPARRAIMARLLAGPATTAQCAEACGLAGNATAYHLRKLARFGFVAEGRRTAYGGRASTWRALAEPGGPAWDLMSAAHRPQQHKRSLPRVLTTADMLAAGLVHPHGETQFSVRVAAPLACPQAALPVPPYTLGAWLGDGAARSGVITSADPEVAAQIGADGLATHVVPSSRRTGNRSVNYRAAGLTGMLRTAGVLGAKHIPVTYLRASEPQRRALLAGLLDTDGTCGKGGQVQFCASNERLARDVLHLVSGLGYKATIRSRQGRLNGRDCKIAWTVDFTPADKVFRLPRKAARQVTATRASAGHRYITAITPVPPVPVRCITVDSPSRLYLAGEACIATHNTGAGKTMGDLYSHAGEIITRHDAFMVGADLAKGRQFFGPIAPAMHYVAYTPAAFRALLDAVEASCIPRAEHLGSLGLETWRPGCGLRYGFLWIEEAADAFESLGSDLEDSLFPLLRKIRSAGWSLIYSLHRASYDQMPTFLRSMVAMTTMGCNSWEDARFGLSPIQIESDGCHPELWADDPEHRGKYYRHAPVLDKPHRLMAGRYFDWGPGTRKMAEHAAKYPASERPFDDVTLPLFAPLLGQPARPAPSPAPATVATTEEDDMRDDLDDDLDEIPGADLPVGDPGPEEGPAIPVSPELALNAVRDQVREWRAAGGIERRAGMSDVITVPDLKPLAKDLGRARTWIYSVMPRLEAEGEVRANPDGSGWLILAKAVA